MALTLVVVQPTSFCNLNCSYCYVPNRRDAFVMRDQVLEAAIGKTLRSRHVGEWIEYLWHSGEPLAAGLNFFRRAVAILRSNLASVDRPIAVYNSVQTNGTLVNDEWCDFFVENQFGVGVSLDGPDFLHDSSRKNWAGSGSSKKALRGFQAIKAAGLKPTVLCVLTRTSLEYPREIIDFFLSIGVDRLAFNVEEIDNANRSSSMTLQAASALDLQERYRVFLSELFDHWWPHRTSLRIREFNDLFDLLGQKLGNPGFIRTPDESTPMGILTVMKDGSLTTYSPEFAAAKSDRYQDFVIGNILTTEVDDLMDGRVFRQMFQDVESGKRKCAEECEYFDLCGSEFLSNKYFEHGTLDRATSSACILHKQTVVRLVLTKLKAMSSLHTRDAAASSVEPAEGVRS